MSLFTISAAAARAKSSAETMRRYADAGIINPVRDSSGRRLFSEVDIQKAMEHRAQTAKRRGRQ